jgi:hypothetical protein
VSCDWDIYCLDCDSLMGFSDANHAVNPMRSLCELGPAFAKIDLSGHEDRDLRFGVEARGHGADLRWLIKHGAHRIKPRDEYGTIDGQCDRHFECNAGHGHHCELDDGHAGACGPKVKS